MRSLYPLFYFGLAMVLSGCAAFGSKTLYKTAEPFQFEPKKIGLIKLASEDELNEIFYKTGEYYKQALEESLTTKQIKAVSIEMTEYSDFGELNKADIAEICKNNALDGIIAGKLKYLYTNYTALAMSIGTSQDTKVELQYFDSIGKLLIHTSHNTANGNTYPDMPSATRTVYDGTAGALKKILKEMKK